MPSSSGRRSLLPRAALHLPRGDAADADAVAVDQGAGAAVGVDPRVRVAVPHALDAAVAASGVMPLPPYIARRRPADARDAQDYQTMFAVRDGSVAAPTVTGKMEPRPPGNSRASDWRHSRKSRCAACAAVQASWPFKPQPGSLG